MKNLCKYLIVGSAVMGAFVGAASSYLTAVTIKNKMTMSEMMKCRSKDAFKTMADRFSL